MITNFWVESRKENWSRLEALVTQTESGGVKALSAAELREMGLRYRQVAADLSTVRSDPTARSLREYLNRLTGRAHNYVYSGKKVSVAGLWQYLAHGYPRLFRRLSGYVAVATMVFLAAAALGAVMALARPEFADRWFIAGFGEATFNNLDKHKMWTDRLLRAMPTGSSQIMTNNIVVCFVTFAGGITAGLWTLYLTFTNGFMLGVTPVVCARHGMALSLWSFMAAHGSLELPSIVIASAAGLRLGAGILFPGMLKWRDSIALGGREAVQLVSATIPLLIVAGSFEGFLSPRHIAPGIKFAVAAVLFSGLVWWLREGGREKTVVG